MLSLTFSVDQVCCILKLFVYGIASPFIIHLKTVELESGLFCSLFDLMLLFGSIQIHC